MSSSTNGWCIAVVVILLLAIAILLYVIWNDLNCDPQEPYVPGVPVVLEIDFFYDENFDHGWDKPLLHHSGGSQSGNLASQPIVVELKQVFDPAEILVRSELDQHAVADFASMMNPGDGSAPVAAAAAATSAGSTADPPEPPCTTGGLVGEVFEKTSSHRPTDETWYAHGVYLPDCCGQTGSEDAQDPYYCGGRGHLFYGEPSQDNPESRPPEQPREKFTVWANTTENDSRPVMLTIAHEFAHVLNADHCDIQEMYMENRIQAILDGNLGVDRLILSPWLAEHLTLHRLKTPDYVRPGSGIEFDDPRSDEHAEMHGWMQSLDRSTLSNSPCTLSFGMSDDCDEEECGSTITARSIEPAEDITLTIEPEEPEYIAGEPVRVNVTMEYTGSPGGQGPDYLSEVSLTPDLGYLRFWVGDSLETAERVRTLVYAEDDLDMKRLEKAERFGLDVWFFLPPTTNGTDEIVLHATYRGFADRSIVARSSPVSIPITPVADNDACGLMSEPATRKFLYYLGGVNQIQGQSNMEQIAANCIEPYSAYANLALGVHHSRRLPYFDETGDELNLSGPSPLLARPYLDRAMQQHDHLPVSYQKQLLIAHARTYELLGDIATDDDDKRSFYEVAVADRSAAAQLGPPPRPLSLSGKDAQNNADTRRAEVEAKLAAFPP